MSILTLIDNNEEFFAKRFDYEVAELNKKTTNFKQGGDIEIKKDQNDPQGIESEAVHFQKQGISQQLNKMGMKNNPSDFFNKNYWGRKEQEEEDKDDDKDLELEGDEEILEDLEGSGDVNLESEVKK